MTALKTFSFDSQAPLRIHTDEDGTHWFVLADVCEALDLAAQGRLAARLPDDEKGVRQTQTPGGPQQMTVINEPGLYRVIFRSRKPAAERFQRWVFHEVLPELGRTGKYVHPSIPDDRPEAPITEREIRHPDGRVVIERYDVGQVTHRTVAVDPVRIAAPPAGPENIEIRVPIEVLRRRFHGAMTTALNDLDEYRRLAPKWRGQYRRKLNSQLKGFVGRARDEWSGLDYHNAVHWLRTQYELDIRWILEPDDRQEES